MASLSCAVECHERDVAPLELEQPRAQLHPRAPVAPDIAEHDDVELAEPRAVDRPPTPYLEVGQRPVEREPAAVDAALVLDRVERVPTGDVDDISAEHAAQPVQERVREVILGVGMQEKNAGHGSGPRGYSGSGQRPRNFGVRPRFNHCPMATHTPLPLAPPTQPAPVSAQQVLGVPLALTDYERTLDWIDQTVERRAQRLHLRRRRPHRDGVPGGPGAARGRARLGPHGPRRPAARVGDEPARAQPPEPRLRARPVGARLRARRRRPARASSSTAGARRRSSGSATSCRAATPACASPASGTRPFRELSTTTRPPRSPPSSTPAGADVIWVGLGVPLQEKWMAAMRERLDAPVLVGVGAAFDFHAGAQAAGARRPPAARARVGVPARPGAAAAVAALPALQPALRHRASRANTARHLRARR